MRPAVLFIMSCVTTSLNPSQSYQFVCGRGQVRLLKAVVMRRPAVGNQEEEDGRVIGDLRAIPANNQSAAVHMLHLHVDGGAAAHWEDKRGRYRIQGGGTERGTC